MDLSFIEEALDNFATFAGAIGNFLTIPFELLQTLLGADVEGDVETTSSALENLSSANDAPAGEDAEAGSGADLSSDEDAS